MTDCSKLQQVIDAFKGEAREHSAKGRIDEASAALKDAKELEGAWERIENGGHIDSHRHTEY